MPLYGPKHNPPGPKSTDDKELSKNYLWTMGFILESLRNESIGDIPQTNKELKEKIEEICIRFEKMIEKAGWSTYEVSSDVSFEMLRAAKKLNYEGASGEAKLKIIDKVRVKIAHDPRSGKGNPDIYEAACKGIID
jgi:hypothetical protein